MQLELQSSQPQWRDASYGTPASTPWNETLHNPNTAAPASIGTVRLHSVPFLAATTNSVSRGWMANITIDMQGVDRAALGADPSYLNSPLALGVLPVDNATASSGINVTMPLNTSVVLGAARLQTLAFDLVAVPVNVTAVRTMGCHGNCGLTLVFALIDFGVHANVLVERPAYSHTMYYTSPSHTVWCTNSLLFPSPQRLNYSAAQCVFPQPRPNNSPNLVLLLAAELSAREVLQAGGFCGDLTRLPVDAKAGEVAVDVQLALQLPTQLRSEALAQRGAAIGDFCVAAALGGVVQDNTIVVC